MVSATAGGVLGGITVVLYGVIALIAENTGHVKVVAEMTGDDLDPCMGRALFADGLGTALSSAIGGSTTTTYAENIGVMAATRVYSTAAYYVAASSPSCWAWCRSSARWSVPRRAVCSVGSPSCSTA